MQGTMVSEVGRRFWSGEVAVVGQTTARVVRRLAREAEGPAQGGVPFVARRQGELTKQTDRSSSAPMTHATKHQLLAQGIDLLLRSGYNDLGISALLEAGGTPKGSFYHHFRSKQDYALQVIDLYMEDVHAGLTACLQNPQRPPLERIRDFFAASEEKYRMQGYLGCLLGGLGQELSGINDVFRHKVEQCLQQIADRLSACLGEAVERGDLPKHADPKRMAERLVNCWEGAALRTRLRRDPAPLREMLDFYFAAAAGGRA